MQTVATMDLLRLGRASRISLYVYIDGALLDAEVDKCEYEPSCGDDTAFSIGNACAAHVSLVISGAFPNLKGHAIQVKWSVYTDQYPLFDGRVEDAVVTAGKTTVDAWDEMYYSGGELFMSTSGNVSADAAFSRVAAAMGVEVDWYSNTLLAATPITVDLDRLNGKCTNSAAAGYIAALVGANAVISRTGKLVICDFAKISYETEVYEGGAAAENADYSVTGVSFLREEVSVVSTADGTSGESESVVTFSAGDGSLTVSNPVATQNAADQAFQNLQSLVFRPGSYTFPGYILLEPGDLFTVTTMDGSYTAAAVKLSMSIDGGVKTTVSAGGAEKTGGAAGTINQALKALEADFARLRHLVAENAVITSARISSLTADDIIAGRIRSTDFQTVVLEQIYPADDLYPAEDLYPNNGEEITCGIEIDFSAGTIRGVFYSAAIESLENRIDELVKRLEDLEKASTGLLYPQSITSTSEEEA